MIAVVQGGIYLADRLDPSMGTSVAGLLALAGGLGLVAGFLTPFASVLAALGASGSVFRLLPVYGPNVIDGRLPVLLVVTMACAILCLGPGAYSIDARLFGRREIIIPKPFVDE